MTKLYCPDCQTHWEGERDDYHSCEHAAKPAIRYEEWAEDYSRELTAHNIQQWADRFYGRR